MPSSPLLRTAAITTFHTVRNVFARKPVRLCCRQYCVQGALLTACVLGSLQAGEAQAAGQVLGEPGWMPVVIARGELREQIEATPIENRPYRPFHIYGNTVRRLHYRGTALPSLREAATIPGRTTPRRPRG